MVNEVEESKTTETMEEEEIRAEDEVPETTAAGKKIIPIRYKFK